MPQLRAPDGSIVNLPQDQAQQAIAGGYVPVSVSEAATVTAAPESAATGGALGAVGAGASGFLSGATLGLSDYAFKGLLGGDFERLAADREAHPFVSGAGQVLGAVVGGPTPSGLTSRAIAEAGEGAGALGRIAASGAEGAVQNAGMYLADTALGDRELSAEGLAASLGPGFLFGAAGGGVALGVEKGTMAARRMFSRVADGGKRAAADAESAWQSKYAATLEANDAAADIARAKLAEAQLARQNAGLARDRAGIAEMEAKAAAARMTPEQQIVDAAGAPPPANVLPPDQAAALFGDLGGGAPAAPLGEAAERELTEALAGHDAARADLESILERLQAPEAGAAGAALGNPDAAAQFGARAGEVVEPRLEDAMRKLVDRPDRLGAGGFPTDEFGAATPRGQVREPRPATAVEAATGDVTAVGKKVPAVEGTPVGVQAAAPPNRFSARGYGDAQPGADFTSARSAARDLGAPPAASGVDVTLDHVNDYLRTGEAAAGGPHSHEMHAVIADLDSVSQSTGLPKKRSVFMPIDEATADGLKRGTQVAEPGYSVMGEEYDVFHSRGEDRPKVLLRLDVPKGAKVGAREGGAVLLPRGSKYRVVSVENEWIPANWNDGAGMEAPAAYPVRIVRAKLLPHEGLPDLPTAAKGGIPDYAAVKAHEAKAGEDLAQTLPARSIADRGYYEPPGGGVDQARMGKAREIYAPGGAGQREPVVLSVTPSGKVTVVNGRHRLAAAIEADAPIKVRWSSGAEPSEDMVLRSAAKGDDLMSQLQGTAAKLDEGHSLGKLSAESPAKAEYVAAKAERSAEAQRHFRAEALAKRDLAEPWNAGFGETTSYEHSGMAAAEREAQQAGRNSTPTSAFRPEELGLRFEPNSRTYHPLSVAKLESDLDAATQLAEHADDQATRVAAQAKIDAIEEQLSRVGARPGAVEDVAAIAEVATKYEQASARLSEALGEAAPPVAKEAAAGVRAAEDTAERKGMDRTARAIDDHVERQGRVLPWEEWKKGKMEAYVKREGHNSLAMQAMGRDYQAYKAAAMRKTPAGQATNEAMASKLDADAALARTRITETEARMASRAADKTAKDARAAAEAARPGPPVAAEPSTLGTIATAIGIAGEVGVPGIPHPKDIPVIGPLLSMYLKYRAIKAATGRFAGRVSATGDTRAAALVAKAKDRVALGVDRMLGLAADAAPKARGPLVVTAAALGHRLFDDGEPDAPKGASSQELAAVRIREIAAAATRPDLVTQHVRRELHGVADPDLIAAAEQHLIARFQYLASVMPKAPPENPFSKTKWLPSPGAASDLAQRLAVVRDPTAAFRIATPAAAETLQKVSPKLFELAKQRLIERVGDLDQPMPYQQRLKGQLLFGIQLDTSMSHIATYQDAFSQTRATPPAAPQSPPVPSIATPTSLSNMYQTAGDRRAARI